MILYRPNPALGTCFVQPAAINTFIPAQINS